MSFTVEVRTRDKYQVLEIRGDLNMYTAPEFKATAEKVLNTGVEDVVVDLARTSYIDSSGIGALMTLHKRLANKQGLALVSPNATVQETFAVLKFDKIFKIFNSFTDLTMQ